MLDTGKHDDISTEDVKRHSKNGDLLEFLDKRNGAPLAIGILNRILNSKPEFGRWYISKIDDLCTTTVGRDYEIKKNGLCLLISYTAEIIQRGDDIRLNR
jgi:hypothetical protein